MNATKSKPIRICIDARLRSGEAGGIEQVVVGLAHGLSKLTDGNEEYIFLAYQGETTWLDPYMGGPCRIVAVADRDGWARRLTSIKPIQKVLHCYGHLLGSHMVDVTVSDGTVEQLGVDLIHFTRQKAFRTAIPSIYHPHDLQHLHLPECFTKLEIMNREARYRTYCEQAVMVAVASSWTRKDLIEQYGLPREKVRVIPLASPVEAYPIPSNAVIEEVRARFRLPDTFAFYPAQTWEHKNHIGLLEALSILRERQSLRIPLVCSGKRTDFFSVIMKRTRQLGLDEQVQHVGFVSPMELQALYRLCRMVVVPSRFEAASFPVWEAFHAGAPVACSNVTSLPDQADDAAELFDPERAIDIARAISKVWNDEKIRQTLAEKGRKRVAQFTWIRTARLFRAHYRRLVDSRLTEADKALMALEPSL